MICGLISFLAGAERGSFKDMPDWLRKSFRAARSLVRYPKTAAAAYLDAQARPGTYCLPGVPRRLAVWFGDSGRIRATGPHQIDKSARVAYRAPRSA
jgi:hypothetical protein